MNQLKKEKLNLAIRGSHDYPFEITEDGLCLIEIIASAKSWWQNLKSFKSFFQDDDLAVKIDQTEFLKLDGRRGFFDGEAAWNGNNLKGLSKTNIFIANLERGNHALSKFFRNVIPLRFFKMSYLRNFMNYGVLDVGSDLLPPGMIGWRNPVGFSGGDGN